MFVFKKPPKVVRRNLYKSNPANDAIVNKLNRLIDKEGPIIVRLLVSAREEQINAVTYKQLREAYLSGYNEQITEWQNAYTKYIVDYIRPELLKAMQVGATNTDHVKFDSTDKDVVKWLDEHTGALITNINEQTRQAVKTLLMYGYENAYSADEMAKVIRPVIGLTKEQAVANARYQKNVYETLLEAHTKMKPSVAAKKAEEAAMKYAGKQMRYRAEVIANTELAYAYNRGYHENMRQAMKAGLIGNVNKVWSTSYDERTCVTCGALHGKVIGFDDSFENVLKKATGYKGVDVVPPAHPQCRCTIMYEETVTPKAGVNEPVTQELTLDEERAVLRYIGSDAYFINEKLRKGIALTEDDKAFIRDLDSALNKMPRYEGRLTRSMCFRYEEEVDTFLKEHEVGALVTNPAYTSTTANDEIYNENGQIQIVIVQSKHGADLRKYNPAEGEVLYSRGAKFRVCEKAQTDDGVYWFLFEEVEDE
ncbi:phage minor head protein [Anaerovibrio sp. RM50]|uniref:phage minor head protein n=1 Tax=Anaerovibrio sp. RM50 TaxID=1200557 RepID=UPI00068713A2|nr:phage minor head protein [Anaerovibrio sp. RM50]